MAETEGNKSNGQKTEAGAEQRSSASSGGQGRPQRRSSSGPRRSDGPRGRGGGRYRGRPKVCYFCTNRDVFINYKGVDTLRRFVTDRGKIRPRRQTGTCARHQRQLSTAIKRARHLALLPFSAGLRE